MYTKTLSTLKAQNQYRSLALPNGVDLTSNDYLGMAVHPILREVAVNALQSGMDVGAAGSRLLRGHTQQHQDLEDFAAVHFDAGRTLYFSSGFQANYAALTTLAVRGDLVFYDTLVHASMRDGLTASKAKSFKFSHNDMNSLEDLLMRHRDKARKTWIAIESVYSMDGDIAPLDQIYALAEQYDAYIIIDEAHGTGVFGDQGKGCAWSLIQKHGYNRLMTVHTCGKAIGVAGGLICASSEIVEFMINAARPFIYSTAPMPLQAFLVQKSLEIIASDEGDERRTHLKKLCVQSQALFGGAGSQIVPIIIGSNEQAVYVANMMKEAGYDIRAIRPPTVPEGTARLRLSLSSELSETVLKDMANVLQPLMRGQAA